MTSRDTLNNNNSSSSQRDGIELSSSPTTTIYPPPPTHEPPSHLHLYHHHNETTSNKTTTTAWQSFVHLLKGYVGPGCLSLPWAMSQLGLPLGCFVIAVVALWTSYNCWNVVTLKRHIMKQIQSQQQQEESVQETETEREEAVEERQHQPDSHHHQSSIQSQSQQLQQQYSFAHHDVQHITYPDVAEWAYGMKFRRLTTTSICVQQLAVCTVFLSFIGENISAVMEHSQETAEGRNEKPPSHALVITLALPFAMLLSCLPNLKVLAPVMVVATLTLMLGFALLGVVIQLEWQHRPLDIDYYWDIHLSQVPLAITAILYSYEGICLILPVESAMEEPKYFAPVFISAMTITAIIFATVASICVICFGDVTNGSVTAFLVENLEDPNAKWWLYMANTACSVAVLLTYPLQLFPSFELIGPWLSEKLRWDFDPYAIEHSHSNPQHHHNNDHQHSGNGGSGAVIQRIRHHPRNFSPIPSCDNPDDGIVGNHDYHHHDEQNDTAIPGPLSSNDSIDEIPSTSYLPQWATFTTPGDSPQLRALLVCFTYIMAIAVPNVQLLVSLAGALSGSATGLIIPPLLELEFLKRQEEQEHQQHQQERRRLMRQSSSTFSDEPESENEQDTEAEEEDESTPNTNSGSSSSRVGSSHTRRQLKRCECYFLFGLGNVIMVFGTGAALWDIIRVYMGLAPP